MATTRNRMATIVFLVFVGSVATVALWAPGASADQFTFVVPVNLSLLDDSIVNVTVNVIIRRSDGAEAGEACVVPIDTATGSFSGTVTCKLDIPGWTLATLPKGTTYQSYRVFLQFTKKNTQGQATWYQAFTTDTDVAHLLKPGAAVKLRDEGRIP